jgi:hypothetical protein
MEAVRILDLVDGLMKITDETLGVTCTWKSVERQSTQ